MDYRKLLLPILVAMLGTSFMHQASAQWGTGGATKIPRKVHLSGFDLFCDMSRVSFGGYTIPAADRVKIVTLPSALNPGAAPSLTFSGEMFCAEVLPGQSGLESAQNGLVGRFKLIQQSPAQRPTSTLTQAETGLVYSGPDASGVRTWTFKVPAVQSFPFPELLYDLVPADDATALKFCHSGVNDCKALLGLQLPATESDYPARDIDGLPGNDLALGEVFKFTTKTTGGLEAAGKFSWGPCHSQAFGKPQTFVVDATANASHDGGVGVATGISLSFGQRFAVTVNQNDLWNSGDQPRWSNADGQIRQMNATGHDDSQTLAGVDAGEIMGTNWEQENPGQILAGNLLKWNGSAWVTATEAAYGTLVGSTDGIQFFILGTAFDGPAPQSGELKLYYWDTPKGDNSEFVTVTVAEESIQCTAIVDNQTVPVIAQGNTRGLRPVQIDYEPTLNVSNKSGTAVFPTVIFGTTDLVFAPNGSPIIDPNGTSVFVNGQPVALKHFSVGDTNGDGRPDLQLKLRRLDVINAVTPGGKCTDGQIVATLEIGSNANGFFGGDDTINLNNCKKL